MKQIPIINKFVQELNPFQEALEKCRLAFYIIFCFAFCINILMLITPLYSLQVLDRVIGSGNVETLIMLSLIIGTIYFVHTLMQIARSFTMIRIGIWLENNISPMLLSHSIASSAIRQSLSTGQLLRDFQLVKNFLTSVGLNTILDAPWTIPYVIVIFMIHPYIGYLTVVGGIVIIILAFVNAAITNRNLGEATEYSIKALNQVEIANRNAEVIEAMGMMKNVSSNWSKINQLALSKQTLASYRNGILSNISRFVRYIMQMCVTGIGAYIVVKTGGREMSTGGMIASSILVGRALAPVDNAIELWKQINNTIKAYKRINDSFKVSNLRDKAMPMLKVTGKLDVESASFSMPYFNSTTKQVEYKPILKNVNFDLNPGEVLAIIGPSAAGKSTLSRLLVGVWRCSSGAVRLDSANVYDWNREDFGNHVGYLPQGVELFSGTIKQNIAKMNEEIDPEKVTDAALMAGAHDLILKLPNGYETDIGIGGSSLSGGQKQRIGLARAFYGNPKFIVLDEPNANLDEVGELALSNALQSAKQKGITVVVISHRPSVLSVVDKILVLQNGTAAIFGDREEVMNQLNEHKRGVHK